MDHNSSAAAAALAALFGSFFFVWIGLIILALVVNWRIAAKAGYAGALSLLMLIPVVNFVVLLIFAFSKWPIEEQLAAARGAGPGTGYGPGTTVAPTYPA
ncbi:MAG: hypothetical protein GIX03_00815 [Candidatus Eremiobacteraeota bacterium]|nr:hypothetical protein [Candidatus Eremiobacteraeota bacterium]